ncbi:YHYH protein [Zobellia galactanivorans]|uniref:YHYH protein n=1 Tax=Zobellia galactanivorans (strain DSM 12802 / CCUG 47099 / CIP 106680 / NCIMB 13871 / Dsij) TaxID=63186 RepID=UPI0026E42E13|nr:YHYH protein [Zobellia galactanivorans]MDO6808804.1 YHYH protein [Zobellia galactanivorans]
MKYLILIILVVLSFSSISAHEGGHGIPLKQWELATNKLFKADFIKYENDEVWLLDSDHTIRIFQISDFSDEDQKYIKNKSEYIHSLNTNTTIESGSQSFSSYNGALIGLGIFLLCFSLFKLIKHKKSIYLIHGVLGLGVVLIVSCKDTSIPKTGRREVPSNDVSLMQTYFGKFEGVTTRSDENYLYVSSNGLPDHDMMVGITNWQQQVPINQDYTGDNSWAIPIHPKMAEHPLSTKTNLLKGAIAVAVNGIPIFNPLNNRGEDANAIGELDNWGGHCGRADDYHYHLPPLHLQDQVGTGNPVAYAVDGFPVYGETTDTLDAYLGKTNPDGSYQYHTIKEYPYFIAGMRGEVQLDPKTKAPENQVYPQPRTQELRPALRPLRGAKIIDFKSLGENSYALTYSLDSKEYTINYGWNSAGTYTYEFINPDGTSTVETYKPRQK